MNLTVNDISQYEILSSQNLIGKEFPGLAVKYVEGDLHTVDFRENFDLIIGNSFLHHFYNLPLALKRFQELLKPGGKFISLHEPTPMATVVEAGKLLAYPLAVVSPGLVNEIARERHKGPSSNTDLWLFNPTELKKISLNAGFKTSVTYPWHLFRSFVSAKMKLHLSENKPKLSKIEATILSIAITVDSFVNRFIPDRFFGSVCIVCTKPST
jgi:ubiquinone/menaquinone biosynthesis C-methylase UbiE